MDKSTYPVNRSNWRRSKGLTLVELVVTLAVATVLMGIAVPSFRDLLETSRVTSQSNELLAGLQAARSEAVRKNATHRFCSSGTGWLVRTPAVATAIREGTFQSNTTVTGFCADFRADGLPYSCTCTSSTAGTALVTSGQITVTSGSKTRNVRIRTGSINVE